jgi:3-hydroxyisobutyrate dehydrogenase
MKVGFVGLGIMGRPMALNLLAAGFPVTVFNRTRDKAEALSGRGAKVADSPREAAAEGDVVITIVSDTPDVEAVLFGDAGVAGGLRPGSTVVDMSTISPRATVDFAARLGALGCDLLDAPVSGGEKGAIEATLTIMVGGSRAAFERCLPVFQALGRTVTHMGPSGAGQKTKLVNQVIGALNGLAVIEGVRLARAAGLDPGLALRAVAGGAASSWSVVNLGPKIVAGDLGPGFTLTLQCKDLRLTSELIDELGGAFPGTELIYALLRRAVDEGFGGYGHHGLIKLWE